MSSTRKLAKNTFYFTLGLLGQKVIAFIYFAFIARTMGVENTGAYFIAVATVLTVNVIADFGIPAVAIREVAKKSDSAKIWLRTIMGMKLITIPVASLIAFFIPIILHQSPETALLTRVAIGVMVLDSFSMGFYGILRGLHNLAYESFGIFITQATIAGVGVYLITSQEKLVIFLIIALLSGSIWNFGYSLFHIVKKLGWEALIPTYKLGWWPIKIAFSFFLAAVFARLLNYSDTLIISRFLGNSSVGLYSIAFKLTNAFRFLPMAFIAGLFPTVSTYSKDPEKLKRILKQSLWYLGLIGFPISFGLWSIAPELITKVYDVGYLDSILPFQIIVFTMIAIFLEFPFGSILNATNNQNKKTLALGISVVVSITLNMILIPKFGIIGGSITALISTSVLFILSWTFIQKVFYFSIKDLIKSVGGLFISALIMAIFVVYLKQYIAFGIIIPLGVIVYLVSAFITGAITKQHLQMFLSLIKRK